MTPEALARLHARAFTNGRGWSAAEFATLLKSPHCFQIGLGDAFAIARAVAGEAELLTIATDPDKRRNGLARTALARFETEALRRGAETAFLEVGADNIAATRLYLSAGYVETARRAGYYRHRDGTREDAVVMRKALV